MGTEHRFYAWLGRWNSRTDAPARPLVIQAAVTVALTVGFGWNQQGLQGFEDSVAFYSPAFLFFLFLAGVSVFVLRGRPSVSVATYRVPLYPLAPLLFCLSSAFMFYNTLDYAIKQTPCGLAVSTAMLGIGAVLSLLDG